MAWGRMTLAARHLSFPPLHEPGHPLFLSLKLLYNHQPKRGKKKKKPTLQYRILQLFTKPFTSLKNPLDKRPTLLAEPKPNAIHSCQVKHQYIFGFFCPQEVAIAREFH